MGLGVGKSGGAHFILPPSLSTHPCSLQAAVALRLIADAEMAEETELVTPSAAAASSGAGLMWAAPTMPRSQAEATAYRFWGSGAARRAVPALGMAAWRWRGRPWLCCLCVESAL